MKKEFRYNNVFFNVDDEKNLMVNGFKFSKKYLKVNAYLQFSKLIHLLEEHQNNSVVLSEEQLFNTLEGLYHYVVIYRQQFYSIDYEFPVKEVKNNDGRYEILNKKGI